MTPILEGGGVSALNTGGNALAQQSSVGAGSGESFPEILSAQGQALASGDTGQGSAAAQGTGGNAVLPGGKKLPPQSGETESDTGEALAAVHTIAVAPQELPEPVAAPGSPAAGLPQTPPPASVAPPLQPAGVPPQPGLTNTVAVPVNGAAPTGDSGTITGPNTTAGPDTTAATAAIPRTQGQAAPVPAGPQALLAATPDPDAAAPPGAALPAATATAEAAVAADAGRLVQPGPAAAEAVRGAGVSTDGNARRGPELAAPALRDSSPVQDTLVRPAAESRVPGTFEIASANVRPQVAVDEVGVVRLPAEALAATPGAELSRPATAASPLPSALVSPLTFATPEAAVPLGSRVDVTGVVVAQPGEPAWNTEVAGRLSLMLRNGTPEANLQLNPPELGRMEVKIATDGDQARILFTVQGAETRDVIEQAMPRLRDMLEQGGLSLSSFDVADQSTRDPGNSGDVHPVVSDADAVSEEIQGGLVTTTQGTRSDALVDYYV